MVALVLLKDPCPKCGKNKWMKEILHVNGREEFRHTCLFCAGLKERIIKSVKDDKYISRKEIRRVHTDRNLED